MTSVHFLALIAGCERPPLCFPSQAPTNYLIQTLAPHSALLELALELRRGDEAQRPEVGPIRLTIGFEGVRGGVVADPIDVVQAGAASKEQLEHGNARVL